MPPTVASATYSVRTSTSLDVQQALLNEQADRQKKGQRISLMDITAEWLEEIAKQKLQVVA
jgi:hypothetical protein